MYDFQLSLLRMDFAALPHLGMQTNIYMWQSLWSVAFAVATIASLYK